MFIDIALDFKYAVSDYSGYVAELDTNLLAGGA
jgi:hypothetical protein